MTNGKNVEKALHELNRSLALVAFLVGHSVTLADFAVWGAVKCKLPVQRYMWDGKRVPVHIWIGRGTLCTYGLEEGPCAHMDWKRIPVHIWIGRGSLCTYGLEEGPCAGMDWKRVPVQVWIGRGFMCRYGLEEGPCAGMN